MRLTPTIFVLFHYPRGCVTTDNTRDKTFKPFGFATVDVNRRGLHKHSRIRYLGATMASLDDQLNKLKDQLAKKKESREAAEARAEYQPEIRELKREQVFDREHIIRLVRTAHELLKDDKKKSPSALAFSSDRRNKGGGRGRQEACQRSDVLQLPC